MKDCVKVRKMHSLYWTSFSNFKICPRYIHEQKILEFKCRNHLTIGEARRIYTQSSKTNYSDAAKTTTTAPNIEEIGRKSIYAQKRRIFGLVESVAFFYPEYFNAHSHNFTSSVIDLTLCSAALLNEVYYYVSDCTFESDHLPIVVSWSKLTNASKYLKTIYWNPILRDSNRFLQSIADPTVEIVTEKFRTL
ncbi:putative RNA-directed DNA polymerase from transposon BS [Caerostris extrusa]|uniref:RNA-directed DNA polymerase from transposon BS n=1 Tax=Caerostris extrusa TaxID=172846 RepID=A0AAV4PJU4_CAEEX|nr:putative RNA-directed DNA polymerase from transposon BS [Caerostris extrusa]